MRELNGEQVLLRVFMGESDRQHGKPSYQAMVEMLRREKISGATVIRGILGYGPHSQPHTINILRLSQDLPIIVEVVDSQENIDRVLPQIEEMAQNGLITMEKVQVVRYGDSKQAGS
jgi:PII-like signaling protein